MNWRELTPEDRHQLIDKLAGLPSLTQPARYALVDALATLPDDRHGRVPLCERIAQVLDVLVPLTERDDFSPADRKILQSWLSDHSLLICAHLISALDLLDK